MTGLAIMLKQFCKPVSGDCNIEDSAALKMQLAKSEISLTLTNKYEVPDSEDCDKNNLLLR
jgi:hypothetical protein